MKIKVIRGYSGEEGAGPDKDVREGTEHTVTRTRAKQLEANGLVTILSDDPVDDDEPKTDGLTISEFVEAGYDPKNYPPAGYASRSTTDEIAAAIAKQETDAMITDGAAKAATPPENKKAQAPANKAAPAPDTKSIPAT